MNIRRVMAVAVVAAATAATMSATSAGPVAAQQRSSEQTSGVMIVLDVSGSMADPDVSGTIKLDGAKQAITALLDELPPNVDVGLRTYPAAGADCGQKTAAGQPTDAGTLQAAVGAPTTDLLRQVRALTAGGATPTGAALQAGQSDLLDRGFRDGVIVLVSDGAWTCAPDPCDIAKNIERSGIDVTVNTVGFNLGSDDTAKQSLSCIAGATGGVYRDASNAKQLADAIASAAAGELSLTVEAPSTVKTSVGQGRTARVPIRVTVRALGSNQADDVVVTIKFTSDRKPVVAKPAFHLGNLAPGDEIRKEWDIGAPLAFADFDVGFEIAASGAQAPEVTKTGTIKFRGTITLDDAGPLLKDSKHVVIMGDSYSAGEGAGDFAKGTDTTDNTCHRSAHTYAVELFPNLVNLACSGAYIADITQPGGAGPGGNNTKVAAQVVQLDQQTTPPDLVLMTLGGNDAGFSDVILSCIFGTLDHPGPNECHKQPEITLQPCRPVVSPYPIDPVVEQILHPYMEGKCWYPSGRTTGDLFLDRAAGIRAGLVNAYLAIDDVLNKDAWTAKRGGRTAPIVVLAYPSVVPDPLRAAEVLRICPGGLSFEEWKFVNEYATALNAAVQSAVAEAAKRGVPITFVPQTQAAMQPSHTICDGAAAYVNYLNVPADAYALAINVARIMFQPLSLIKIAGENTFASQFHPNANGYKAETAALVDFSVTAAADNIPARNRPTTGLRVTNSSPSQGSVIDLQNATSVTITQGGSFNFNLNNLDPLSGAQLVAHSTSTLIGTGFADSNGHATIHVDFPDDFALGSHTIEWLSVHGGIVIPEQLDMNVVPPRDWIDRIPVVALAATVGVGLILIVLWWLFRRRLVRQAKATSALDEHRSGPAIDELFLPHQP